MKSLNKLKSNQVLYIGNLTEKGLKRLGKKIDKSFPSLELCPMPSINRAVELYSDMACIKIDIERKVVCYESYRYYTRSGHDVLQAKQFINTKK